MWCEHRKWCREDKKIKIRKIKKKIYRMWCGYKMVSSRKKWKNWKNKKRYFIQCDGEMKWCRKEKKRKLEN